MLSLLTTMVANEYGAIDDAPERDYKLLNMAASLFDSPKILIKSRMAESYDPENWLATIGAVISHSYFSKAFVWISFVGSLSVVLSALPVFIVPERTCRAWCSHIALGPQAHTYIGLVL